MDLARLQTAVHYYYTKGLALSTNKTYIVGQQCYLDFCFQSHQTHTRTSEHVLLLFSAHLASAGLTYSTIKAYLSAVRNLHVTAGCHAAYSRALTPGLEQVLRGIKKDQSERLPKRICLPISQNNGAHLLSSLGCTNGLQQYYALGCLLHSILWFPPNTVTLCCIHGHKHKII